jgi:hypothetical protein
MNLHGKSRYGLKRNDRVWVWTFSLLSITVLQFGAVKPSRLVRKISSIFRIYLKHGNINFRQTHVKMCDGT